MRHLSADFVVCVLSFFSLSSFFLLLSSLLLFSSLYKRPWTFLSICTGTQTLAVCPLSVSQSSDSFFLLFTSKNFSLLSYSISALLFFSTKIEIENPKTASLGTHWPSCAFSEVPVFFIFLGVFMKSGKIVLRPRMSTNLWQLSVPSGPIMPWSRTFSALVRDTFFSLCRRDRKQDSYVISCMHSFIHSFFVTSCSWAIYIFLFLSGNFYFKKSLVW